MWLIFNSNYNKKYRKIGLKYRKLKKISRDKKTDNTEKNSLKNN